MDSVNYTFFLSISIIGIGYLFKAVGILQEESGKVLSGVVINITLPAMILITISDIELDFSLSLMPLFCLGFCFLAAILAWWLFKRKPQHERGAALLSAVGFNAGLFAYPLVEGLFGSSGLKQIAMFDLGNAFIVFGLSYFLGYLFAANRQAKKITLWGTAKLLLKSVPFMSYILALGINLSGLSLPGPLYDLLEICARANMGLALLVLGLTLSFRFDKSHWKLISQVVLLRYGTGILAGSLLFFLLPFPLQYKTILLFALNLPVGLATIPFAAEFGYDIRLTGTIANLMIMISFLFMWVFLLFLAGPLQLF